MAAPDPHLALASLGARFGLSDKSVSQLRKLAQRLAEDPLAPTAVRELPRVIEDHLADSLVALELPELVAAKAVADIGAGAGLPGLPLAAARPSAQFFLVESHRRKADFIERAAADCDLQNVTVVAERVETWAAQPRNLDVVTARALAPLDVVAEYAAPLLRIGGALVAWRGARDPETEVHAARAAELLGMAAEEPRHVAPYPGAAHRHLHVLRKIKQTPDRFPRRPGVARKRPLGASPTPAARTPEVARASDRVQR